MRGGCEGWLWGVAVDRRGSMWSALSILMQWKNVWHQHKRALSNLSSCCNTVCSSFLNCLVTSGGLGAPFSKATLALDFFLFSGLGVPGCESKSVRGLPALRLLISSYSSNPPSSIACTHGFTWWDIRYAWDRLSVCFVWVGESLGHYNWWFRRREDLPNTQIACSRLT